MYTDLIRASKMVFFIHSLDLQAIVPIGRQIRNFGRATAGSLSCINPVPLFSMLPPPPPFTHVCRSLLTLPHPLIFLLSLVSLLFFYSALSQFFLSYVAGTDLHEGRVRNYMLVHLVKPKIRYLLRPYEESVQSYIKSLSV